MLAAANYRRMRVGKDQVLLVRYPRAEMSRHYGPWVSSFEEN